MALMPHFLVHYAVTRALNKWHAIPEFFVGLDVSYEALTAFLKDHIDRTRYPELLAIELLFGGDEADLLRKTLLSTVKV
jgi:hypothetical protein